MEVALWPAALWSLDEDEGVVALAPEVLWLAVEPCVDVALWSFEVAGALVLPAALWSVEVVELGLVALGLVADWSADEVVLLGDVALGLVAL